MAAGRNVLNFNVKCFQDNGSFLHPAKKADAHQLSKTKKKKTQLKLAWKKNRKTDGQRRQKKKEKKRMKLPARIVLHVADTTQIYTWDKWFCQQDRSSCQRGFRMVNNIACCCASMGTRILLTSLVDLVTGCVRTKWLTWNHCEAKK